MFSVTFSDENESPEAIITEGEKESPNISVAPITKSNISLFESYKTTLTSFGVRRIRRGKMLERFVWIIGILFIICFTCFTLYRNTARYFAYGARTEIRSIETMERNLPVITFCLAETFLNNFFCYNNSSFSPDIKCEKTATNGTSMWYLDSVTNGEWMPGKNLGDNCHVFNENGTMMLTTGTGFKRVAFLAQSPNDSLFVTFQTPEEFRNRREMIHITNSNQLIWLKKGSYQIHIKEKHTKRLPDPYAPGCTNSEVDSNRFSDIYTHDSCLEACAYDHMFKQCHDVVDIWKKYKSSKYKFSDDLKFNSTRDCLGVFAMELAFEISSHCFCKRACKETTYTGRSERLDSNFEEAIWDISLHNDNPVTEIELFPDFPLEQYLGTFGGVLGLGGKLQFVFQLFVFMCLFVGNFLVHNRQS